MICSHCNKNEATTHIKQTVNGVTQELYLCSECAKKLGLLKEFEPISMDSLFGNFLGAGVSALNSLSGIDRCEYCGSSFNDIINSGKVGCANCYTRFEDKLEPSIEKLHGRTKHIGKTVTYTTEEDSKPSKIEDLKDQLKQAIQQQRFEDAAKIRDEIKTINEGE